MPDHHLLPLNPKSLLYVLRIPRGPWQPSACLAVQTARRTLGGDVGYPMAVASGCAACEAVEQVLKILEYQGSVERDKIVTDCPMTEASDVTFNHCIVMRILWTLAKPSLHGSKTDSKKSSESMRWREISCLGLAMEQCRAQYRLA